jgi:hypothetical protein
MQDEPCLIFICPNRHKRKPLASQEEGKTAGSRCGHANHTARHIPAFGCQPEECIPGFVYMG